MSNFAGVANSGDRGEAVQLLGLLRYRYRLEMDMMLGDIDPDVVASIKHLTRILTRRMYEYKLKLERAFLDVTDCVEDSGKRVDSTSETLMKVENSRIC